MVPPLGSQAVAMIINPFSHLVKSKDLFIDHDGGHLAFYCSEKDIMGCLGGLKGGGGW